MWSLRHRQSTMAKWPNANGPMTRWPNDSMVLPVVHRPILLPIDGQVGRHVGIPRGERFVDIDAKAGCVAGMHRAALDRVVMREDGVRLRRVPQVLLNAEVVHAEIEV